MSAVDEQSEYEAAGALAKRLYEAWPFERFQGFGEGIHVDWTHLY